MSLALTIAPAVEPVSTAEFKLHARIDADMTDEDTLISDMIIPTARHMVEQMVRRQLITATYRMKMRSFPGSSVIYFPYAPIQSVTSLSYTDTAGDTQTLDAALYSVDVDSAPGRLILNYGEIWPSVQGHDLDVSVTYVAGYGDASTDVPQALRHAINLIASDLYENREDTIINMQNFNISNCARALCYPFIMHSVTDGGVLG